MSDDAAHDQRKANAPAVGTVRKADDAPGGDAARAAPRAKVSAEDLARALGGAADASTVKTDTSEAHDASNFAISEGDRVEVRWVISAGEGETPHETVVWWGATARAVVQTEDDTRASKRIACDLHYDENEDLGFDAEVRSVVFIDRKILEDPGERTNLRWRVEGDGDGADAGDDDDSFEGARTDVPEEPLDPNVVHVAEVPIDSNGNVSMNEMINAQRAVDDSRNGGVTLEQLGTEAFGTLPMDSQLKMASAFSSLKDGLSRAFAELQARNGPEYAITKDDIAEIMRTMHASG